MARLYHDPQGKPLRLSRSAAEDAMYPVPSGYTSFVEFDEDTNQAAIDAILKGWNTANVLVLTKTIRLGLVPVPITPDSQRKVSLAALTKFAADQTLALQVIGDVTKNMNSAELMSAVKTLAQGQFAILNYLTQTVIK